MTEEQLQALKKAKEEKQAMGEIETEHPGYLGAQDTFYVGTLKGVGRIYQQTFIDTYCKVGFAKVYDRKTPLVGPIFSMTGCCPSMKNMGYLYCGYSRIVERSFVGIESTMSMSFT